MMFASRLGLQVDVSALGEDPLAALFSEELGAVIQVKRQTLDAVMAIFDEQSLTSMVHRIGDVECSEEFSITFNDQCLYRNRWMELQKLWSDNSYQLQKTPRSSRCCRARIFSKS